MTLINGEPHLSRNEVERIVDNLNQRVLDGFVMIGSHMIEKPLTRQGAADYFGINIKTLDRRLKTGVLPARLVHKNGGTPYFFASELEQLLKKS